MQQATATKNISLPYWQKELPVNFWLALALAVDILTPFLIWKGFLPSSVRWISRGAVAVVLLDTFFRMMLNDYIPKGILVLAGLSLLGCAVGVGNGQSIQATLWGWWLMYQFPIVGVYTYLERRWPKHFPHRVLVFMLFLLGINVLVQIGQWLTGEIPGDDLAGLFGYHGTADLVLFIILIVCLAMGKWLAKGSWFWLLSSVCLGLASSILGEMKLFLVAIILLGVIAAALYSWWHKHIEQFFVYAFLIALVASAFVFAYNLVVAKNSGSFSLQTYLTKDMYKRYLTTADRVVINGEYYYNMGRNFALIYGWREISKDPMILTFGMGLGARGESRTLGTAGIGLSGMKGAAAGTSLLVIMQETGLVGMLAFIGFMAWVISTLMRDILRHSQSPALETRFGLLLFTLLWPLWLWYGTSWTFRVPMLFYWALLGYVLAEANRPLQGSIYA